MIAGALARAYQIERGGKTIKGVLVETDHRRQSPRAVFVPLNMKGKTIYPGKAEVGISENWMFEPVKQVK